MPKNESVWFAVDRDGREKIFDRKPSRMGTFWVTDWEGDCVYLPKGFIENLTGRKLTWDDAAIKWTMKDAKN